MQLSSLTIAAQPLNKFKFLASSVAHVAVRSTSGRDAMSLVF